MVGHHVLVDILYQLATDMASSLELALLGFCVVLPKVRRYFRLVHMDTFSGPLGHSWPNVVLIVGDKQVIHGGHDVECKEYL